MENNKTPSIRFKGFTDPWEQRKLGEVFESLQNNTLSRAELSVSQGNAKNIHYGDILVKYGEVLNIGEEQLPMITDDAVITKFKSSFLQNGDVIVADTAEDETVGKCTEIEGLQSENVISGLHTIPYRPLFKFASGYLGYYMNSAAYHNQLLPLMQGIKVTSISKSAMQNTDIVYPKSLDEQMQIGEYFANLDNLITLHQRKYNKLLNVKKSMLEKMFPKNESNIPEIRFKGFTDPWEQRKFADITFLSGEKNKDNLPYESYSVTNENGFVPQNEQFENGGTMATADKRMYYIVSKNSFAYNPARINVGSIGYYDGSENVIVSSLYEVFKTSEDIDDRYLWHWFKSNNFKKLIEQYQEGGVRLYFYYDKLCMCFLPTPSIQEQIKIGRYFDNLDNLITLHQRELEKLQNIKKFMLEKMFV